MWLALGGAALAVTSPGSAVATNWPQTYFNAGHSSYNSTETAISASNVSSLQLLWGQGVAGGVTSFVLDTGTIYAQGQGSSVPNLAAIDAATGTTLWTITTGNDGTGGNSIAVGSGHVFTGCSLHDAGGGSYGAICAYGKAHGRLIWHFGNPCDCLPEAAVIAPLVYSDGTVYFGYGNGGAGGTEYIVAADAVTGDVLWTYVTGGPNTVGYATLAVGNGMVYFGCGGNQFSGICAVSQSSGSLVWSVNLGSGYLGLTLGSNNVLYVNGGYLEEIAALNATTGATLWSVPLANTSAFPVSLAKGIIYATGSDGYVHALRATTGHQIWSAYLASESSVSIANGVLYDEQQGSNNYPTAAYDVSNGALLWTSPAPASTLHPPPIIANGTLYITNGSCGSVCAYGLPTE